MVKNLPANAGDIRDAGSIPGSGRSPGGGHGNPLQYSSLENSTDREAWQAIVHWAAKSWTRLKRLSTAQHTYIYTHTDLSSTCFLGSMVSFLLSSLFVFFGHTGQLWDLSSPTRDQTPGPQQ